VPSLRAAVAIATNLLAELVAPSACAACEVPVKPNVLFCTDCALTVERSPVIPGETQSAFEYGGAVETAIARLKYQDRPDLGPRLGASMLRAAEAIAARVDLVVPVPLYPRRLAERGYNQAALLAAPIARALGARLGARVLRRVRDTPRQALLDRAHRLHNVVEAFIPQRHADARGARVLLVDDVSTTGATLRACRAALHEAGASHVSALVLARRA